MTEFQYKRAPITEAVVEFRSDTRVNDKKCEKALKRMSKNYDVHNPLTQRQYKFKVEPKGEMSIQTTDSILNQFTSDDMTQQLHITDLSFRVSQLAPYAGWEEFELRIKRDWMTWRKIVGFRPIDFVGMRYINRIDIPITESLVHFERYLNVYPNLPDYFVSSAYHSLNVRVNLEEISSVLNLKSAIIESPLPNYLSIVVDLDITRKYQKPPKDGKLYSFLGQARIKKNEIFEACITDKARELFNK